MARKQVTKASDHRGVIGKPFTYPVGQNRVGHDLSHNDFVWCVPVDRFTCDGLYLLDSGLGPALYTVQSTYNIKSPGVRIWTNDPKHSDELTAAQFNSILVAQVAAKMIVMCTHLLGELHDGPPRIPGGQRKIAA